MEMPPIRYTHARDGTRIAYTIIPGASPPWLHIYSLSAPPIELDFSIGARAGYIRNLARGRATVLYDPRGSGLSGPIRGRLTLDDLVDDVAAITTAVGGPLDVSVMGSGCFVAMRYAGRRRPGWRSLLLIGALTLTYEGSFDDRAQAQWHVAGDYLGMLGAATRVSMDVSPAEAPAVARRLSDLVPECSAAAYREAVVGVDLADDASRVAIPSLVISSPNSRRSAELAARMPGSRLAFRTVLVNSAELGAEARDLWDEHIGSRLADDGELGREPPGLSLREVEVLLLVASGRSNAEIAEELTLSVRTVERHVQNVYRKLNVHNRVAAASWAPRYGEVP